MWPAKLKLLFVALTTHLLPFANGLVLSEDDTTHVEQEPLEKRVLGSWLGVEPFPPRRMRLTERFHGCAPASAVSSGAGLRGKEVERSSGEYQRNG